MSNRVTDPLVALSLANLALLLTWRELLYASPSDSYWIVTPSKAIYLAALLNMAWLTSVFLCGALVYRKINNRIARLFMCVAFLCVSALPLNYLRLALHINESVVHVFRENLLIFLIVLIIFLFVITVLLLHLTLFVRIVYMSILIFSPSALFNAGYSVWMLLNAAKPLQSSFLASPASPAHKAGNRVVWLLFDELDQALTFFDRPSSVRLPAFDQFRNQAVFAINSQQVSSATEIAIPSMLIGKEITRAYPVSNRDLMIRPAGTKQVISWRKHSTLFSEAFNLGKRLEIVGFYHPYCRIFSGLYERCSQFSMNTVHTDVRDSLLENMKSQIISMLPINRRRNAVVTYLKISKDITKAVADPSIDLVYGHLSVPHGPNIYRRQTGEFTYFNTDPDAYFDNLVLADKLLAQIRASMEQIGLWDQTTVVISSDHGLRHSRLVDRERDRRVPFVLKLPGQQVTYRYEPSFSSTLIKNLLIANLKGTISNPQELIDWLNAHR